MLGMLTVKDGRNLFAEMEEEMIFGKKRKEKDREKEAWDEALNLCTEKILDAFRGDMQKNQKDIKRLSQTVEDFLDELQEEQERVQEEKECQRETSEREGKLLELVQLYQEQMELLEQWIYKDGSASWRRQYDLLKGRIETEKSICSIESVGSAGEYVDYRLHEVVEAVGADTDGQEGTVAQVYCQGMLYHGQVMKKAKVQAYKR